jgi:hypothetical protein
MTVIARANKPGENRLLAALPSNEYERLLPQLEHVSLSPGEVVYEFGGNLDYVFFPINSIVSLLYTMENGTSAEMGLTGSDGVVGIALFMGGGTRQRTPTKPALRLVPGFYFRWLRRRAFCSSKSNGKRSLSNRSNRRLSSASESSFFKLTL